MAKKILNPVLLLLAINQVVTALLYDVPEHAGSMKIISDETFEFLHEGGGYVFVSLIVFHIILNLNWVRKIYFS
jgi:hypothetical protein